MNGNTVTLLHLLYAIEDQIESGTEGAELDEVKNDIRTQAAELTDEKELDLFTTVLSELQRFADPGDTYVQEVLDGRTPAVAAQQILAKTDFANEEKLNKLLDKKPKKIAKDKDVLFQLSELLIPKYYSAVEVFQSTGPTRRATEERVAKEVFKVFGDNLPPDATFTLRISDGLVKSYAYNGTVAPYKTTYFGMYDRHYSNNQNAPWALPARWANPSLDLLKSPLNFVATTDIIGGNSGSPMINKNHEVVGLVFDGNIESLPGNFIFDEEKNRTVAVHAGGITAALRYVYKADRLLAELLQN
jgi:hypothetical protein